MCTYVSKASENMQVLHRIHHLNCLCTVTCHVICTHASVMYVHSPVLTNTYVPVILMIIIYGVGSQQFGSLFSVEA